MYETMPTAEKKRISKTSQKLTGNRREMRMFIANATKPNRIMSLLSYPDPNMYMAEKQ
jgi:hypothetical protein